MPESYQSWADRMLLEEHKDCPERFTKYPPMSATQSISTYSDAALKGAIDSLAASRAWPSRLFELRAELDRRKRNRRAKP